MIFGFFRPSATARALADLQEDVRRLSKAVKALERQRARDVERLHKLIAGHEARWQAPLRAIEHRIKEERKWRGAFSNQLAAVVRRLWLPVDRLEPAVALGARRFRLRSQNEEDGVLLALLDQAGWGGRRFVEIGSGSSGGTAAVLAYECGWSGLMFELSARGADRARARFRANPGVTVVCERVTPENVNSLLERHGYLADIDLLSIDIDSHDYWVLEALQARPRLLVLEYNALFGPDERVTIPRGQTVEQAPKGYGGASLAALTALAGRRGYRLVVCEDAGVNAFFLREDVAPEIPAADVARAFKPLRDRLDHQGGEVERDIYRAAREAGLPLEYV